ncbi:peptidoglycan-binding protein [Streptomyces mirabilis]
MATSVAAKIISLARGEVGYHEGKSGGHWNNIEKYAGQVPGLSWANGQAWCQTFQSWLALKGGSAKYEPSTASCLAAASWFKQRGRFSQYPAIGAQVFFGPNGGTHVGRVIKYNADTIWTVEGNTNVTGSAEGDGVYQRSRPRRSANTYGYGLPAFPEGIVTADPALKGKRGFTYKATADAPAGAPAKPATSAKVDLSNLVRAFEEFPHNPAAGSVAVIQHALAAEKLYKGKVDGAAGKATKAAYKAWQIKRGYRGKDADGIPGQKSLAALAKKYKFALVS